MKIDIPAAYNNSGRGIGVEFLSVQVGAQDFALDMVDGVNGIIGVTDDMRQTTPDTANSAFKNVIDGLVNVNTRIVSIISSSATMLDISDLHIIGSD